VKEDEEDDDLHSLVGEAIVVMPDVTLEQPVGAHLAQVVAELVQTIAGRGLRHRGQDSLVNWGGAPAGQPRTAME
jgi:hypothetical protein